MPDISKDFDSAWLKANLNVKQHDNIRFLDAGTRQEDEKTGEPRWIFTVGIVRNGEIIATKKFQLNRSNFKAVSKIYGTVTEKWEKKEMTVNVIKRQNPRSGELVDSIALSPPGEPGEVEVEDEE